MNDNGNHHHDQQPPDPDFLYALRRDLPRSFGEALYAQLGQAETGDEKLMEMTLQPPQVQSTETNSVLPARYSPTAVMPRRVQKTRAGGVQILTLTAMMILFALVSGVMLKQFADSSLRSIQPGAQPTPPPLDALVPITEDNAASLTKLYTLGSGAIQGMDWSPDSLTIALATSRGVYLYDSDNLETPRTLLGGQEADTREIVYSEDGTKLAGIRTEGRVTVVTIWNADTGEVLARFPTELQYTILLGFGVNGTQLIGYGCTGYTETDQGYSLCNGTVLGQWDVLTGERIGELTDLDVYYPGAIHLSENGERIAYIDPLSFSSPRVASQTRTITVVDLTDGRRASLTTDSSMSMTIALQQDGSQLAILNQVGDQNVRLELLDVETFLVDPERAAEEARLLNRTHSGTLFGMLVFLPQDNGILVRSNGPGIGYLIFPLDETDDVDVIQTRLPPIYFDRFLPSPDGSRVLTTVNSDWLQLRELISGEIITSTQAYSSYYNSLSFTPDQHTLIAAGNGTWGPARAFDLSTEPPTESPFDSEMIETINQPTTVAQVIYSPDGKQAYYATRSAAGQNLTVRHNLETGESRLMQTFGYSSLVTFAQDGSMLQVDHDETVRRFGPDLTELSDYSFRLLQGSPDLNRSNQIRGIFSPDRRMLIASVCLQRPPREVNTIISNACLTSELRAYSVNSGALLAALDGLDFHFSSPLITSSDGRYLAGTGCAAMLISTEPNTSSQCDGFVLRLWDLEALYEVLDAEEKSDERSTPMLPVPNEAEIERLAPIAVLSDQDFSFYTLALAPVDAEDDYDSLLMATQDNTADTIGIGLWRIDLNAEQADTAFSKITALMSSNIAQGLAFSPDSTLLVAGGAGLVELWGTTE